MNQNKFRYIKFKKFDAFMNMALDESICESVKKGSSLPTIRLYGWSPSAISIGYFQGLKNEVDENACSKFGVDFVRRRTGGGAVYHDKEITYSIIAPVDYFSKDIVKSYEEICSIIIDSLGKLGIKARFSPINDVVVGETAKDTKKISGSAQTRRNGMILQHGTILFEVDVDKMFSLLKVGKEKIKDKLIQSVKKRVTSVKDEKADVSEEDLLNALEEVINSKFEIQISEYTSEELKRAEELKKERYFTKEWNEMR